MIKPPSRDQVIALAGLFQACALVDILARTGQVEPEALSTAITSLLEQNPDNCEATFGSIAKLSAGFDAMEKLLSSDKKSKNQDLLRYVLGLIYLQGKILKNSAMLNKIGEGIARSANQAQHFSPDHDNVISSLADLYSNSISTYRFRIQVNGQSGFLQQDNVARRIRVLLFSGIRAAILWHQTGGRRWHFMFYRKQILKQIQQLRREC